MSQINKSETSILYRGNLSGSILETHARSPFFNYGRGFFETLLYENGRLQLFPEHVQRMKKTCRDFGIRLDYTEISEDKISILLEQNKLSGHTARVKILYAPVRDAARWDTVVTAEPYTRPLQDFVLSIHRGEIQDTKLNRYKSLNYQYNLYWKEFYGKKENSDEVLFLNRQGNILEGSFTNVLFIKDSVLGCVGKNQNCLRGIMQDKILSEAPSRGLKVKSMKEGIPLKQLLEADKVFLCNSLLGEKRVRKILS